MFPTIEFNHLDCFQPLINAKADLEAKHSNGNTALIYAALIGRTKYAQLLIDADTDIGAKGGNDITPFMSTVRFKLFDCRQLLVDTKADLEAHDKDGRTALMLDAIWGSA